MWNLNISTKKAGETRTIFVAFTDDLSSTELLTGTPTVEELNTSALTITDEAINVDEGTLMGRTIKAYQGVTFSVSGGVARSDYTIRVTVGTDASPAQTFVRDIRIAVK